MHVGNERNKLGMNDHPGLSFLAGRVVDNRFRCVKKNYGACVLHEAECLSRWLIWLLYFADNELPEPVWPPRLPPNWKPFDCLPVALLFDAQLPVENVEVDMSDASMRMPWEAND